MRPSTRKSLVAHAVGLLFYLGGMLLFLTLVLGAFLGETTRQPGEYLIDALPLLLLSMLLIMIGRLVSWKYGGSLGILGMGEHLGGPSKQSRLEELGYRLPNDEDDREDASPSFEDGTLAVVCAECGTENQPDFRFCRNCSSELPD